MKLALVADSNFQPIEAVLDELNNACAHDTRGVTEFVVPGVGAAETAAALYAKDHLIPCQVIPLSEYFPAGRQRDLIATMKACALADTVLFFYGSRDARVEAAIVECIRSNKVEEIICSGETVALIGDLIRRCAPKDNTKATWQVDGAPAPA